MIKLKESTKPKKLEIKRSFIKILTSNDLKQAHGGNDSGKEPTSTLGSGCWAAG